MPRDIRISYNIEHGIPKRDLFDVKHQLMQKDELTETDKILLGNEDLRVNQYEGGLKVWDCSYDMLNVLSTETLPTPGTSIVELGCGAALPSLYIFKQVLENNIQNVELVLADYNDQVLSLVTAPNVLLAWKSATHKDLAAEFGDFEVTPELLTQFASDLEQRNIKITFVSGAWSPQFVRLLGRQFDLVLACETIYSLDTLPVFTDTMLNLVSSKGKALIGAKKMYFGVGGGIPDFVDLLDSRESCYHETVYEASHNVGRAVIQVSVQPSSS
ncbi:histidine protein methyltransferase 1 [Trichomonascus vanleenenianus]|uniref:protein-histidine N-methyltransferase n=1 Tax=Trichomonascus vanleenenianus TaxID=2268995 RepID=UPI003ECA1499